MKRPKYLDKERHEHPVFRDTTQEHAHALARELWKWCLHLEKDHEQMQEESRGLQRTIVRLEKALLKTETEWKEAGDALTRINQELQGVCRERDELRSEVREQK